MVFVFANKQNYDIYNKEFVYSIGDDVKQKFIDIYTIMCTLTLLDFVTMLQQSFDVTNLESIASIHNGLLKEILNYTIYIQKISLLFKQNSIVTYNYIKLY